MVEILQMIYFFMSAAIIINKSENEGRVFLLNRAFLMVGHK